MPNWTINTIKAKPEIIEEMKKKYSTDENAFDFNKLIPMPEALNVEAGGQNYEDLYYYLSEKLTTPHDEVIKNPLSKLIYNRFNKGWISEVRKRIENGTIRPSYKAGKVLCDNFLNYSSMHWFDWCNANWGTKWNASKVVWSDNDVSFWTAWTAPIPIFKRICEDFPNAKIAFESEYEEGFRNYYFNDNGNLFFQRSEDIYDSIEEWEAAEAAGAPPCTTLYERII